MGDPTNRHLDQNNLTTNQGAQLNTNLNDGIFSQVSQVSIPTGRLINQREAYQIDLELILKAAKERNYFLEINAQPERLDLVDIHCRMAKT